MKYALIAATALLASPAFAQDAAKGEAEFKKCKACHAIIADDGTAAPYDRLLIATGSTPFRLPIPGNQLPGVIGYRDIQDTDEMIAAASQYRHAVVIGGGLLGLEAANGLKLRGMDVTVVHNGAWLLERQLDEVAGRMLQQSLEQRGMTFLIGECIIARVQNIV